MKTIQTVARYFPEKCGGIQIRLSELLPALRTHGIESTIAAPLEGTQAQTYQHEGVAVYRYPVSPMPKSEPNYGISPHGEFEQFAQWLKAQNADLYHQHQWTPTCGLPHLKLAKQLGMATLVSIRLPEPICQRQTLMLHDREACDGKIDLVRCSQCCGVSSSIPASAIAALSQTPMPISVAAGGALRRLKSVPGAIASPLKQVLSPLAYPAFIAARHQGLLEMAKYADRVVTLSQRLHDMLLTNGVPQEKLVICRTGIADSYPQRKAALTPRTEPLKVVFLGRWHPTKGIHILVEAIKSLPADIPLKLTIHAIPNVESYQQEVMQRIGDDPRIQVASQLGRNELASTLATYDVLALPAQWFDVRPMVVMEAHASGLPVIGSDMGGIPELIRHGEDGLLVPTTDISAWAQALSRLAIDPNLLNHLRQGIQPIRTLSMEAADLTSLYHTVLAEQSPAKSYSFTPELMLCQASFEG